MLRLAKGLLVCLLSFFSVDFAFGAGVIAAAHTFPIAFEANRGQAPAKYSFVFHRDGVEAGFSRNSVYFSLAGSHDATSNLRLELLGGEANPEGKGALTGHSNYFSGNDASRWIRNVPLYSAIEYDEIAPGISLSFYGNGSELEHDFRVEPGADVSRIRFRIEGASSVDISAGGDLEIHASSGVLQFRKPTAYQDLPTGRAAVDASFRVGSDGVVGFSVSKFDRAQPLIIDPVFVFSSYLAGTGTDAIQAVTTDSSGNILVTGTTASIDFPTANALEPSLGSCWPGGGCSSAFVTKIDPTGSRLIYSTYIGGSNGDVIGGSIAVDAAGNAIVAGKGEAPGFPTAGAIPSPGCAGTCYFLLSLKPDGSALNYSGVLNAIEGSMADYFSYNDGIGTDGRVTVDSSGNAYLAGVVSNANFPITAGTLTTSVQGYPQSEMFVMKVDPTGKVLYATVVPGIAPYDPTEQFTNTFLVTGITVDKQGTVTTAGTAGPGLPSTQGTLAPQFLNSPNNGSATAGFVLQLNPTASAINFASYLPGTDRVGGLAVDGSGNLWLAGTTSETTLPVSANAFQKTASKATAMAGAIESGYIMEVNPAATTVLVATYLDGSGTGQSYEGSSFTGIALDAHTNVLVGGVTESQDFPLVNSMVGRCGLGSCLWDLVVAQMSSDLSTLKFSSLLSATQGIYAGATFSGLAVDNADNLIITGTTFATTFPTTVGSFEPQMPQQSTSVTPFHSFVSKINVNGPSPAACLDTTSVAFGNVSAKTSVEQTVHLTNCGNAPLSIISVVSSDPTVAVTGICSTVAAGSNCPLTLVYTPVSSAAANGSVAITTYTSGSPQMIAFTGQGIAPKIIQGSSSINFGNVTVGAPALTKGLALQNFGQVPLTIGNVSVLGPGFSLAQNNCTQPVASNGSCNLQLSFAPVASGTQNGSVVISSNDPATPQLTLPLTGFGNAGFGLPIISTLSIETPLLYQPRQAIQINPASSMTIEVLGSNFYPQSVIQLDGKPQTTSFYSNGSLGALVRGSDFTNIAEVQLTVVNPGVGGGVSLPVPIIFYLTLDINPAFMVFSPAKGKVYAAIPANAPSNPNTVIPIDPATGSMGAPIPVGHNPALLAASSDGSYLFVALQGDQTVQRINLGTGLVDRTFPYPQNVICPACGVMAATDLQAVPGSPSEVLLAQAGTPGSTLSLFNDGGFVNIVPPGPVSSYPPAFGSVAFAGNPSTIYALPFTGGSDTTGPYFQVVDITPSGLVYVPNTGIPLGSPSALGANVISDGTLLYTSAGSVWDPATQKQVGTFPETIYNITTYPNLRPTAVDGSQFYSIGLQTINQVNAATVLSAYSKASYAVAGTLLFEQITDSHLEDLSRWGADGLAFIGTPYPQTDREVVLLRSSLASAPSPSPAPVLSSVSPTSATAGGAAFTLNLSGTGFASTSLVEWNGTQLATTFVSSQQLTTTVPAVALLFAGRSQVTVFTPTPGGGNSVALPFTVVAPVPAATLSQSQLTFAGQNQGSTSASQTVTLTSNGTATLAIESIAASGDFNATSNCGASVAAGASCTISVTFSPSATGSRTGTLTVTDNAANSPQTVSLSGTGVVAMTFAPSQGGSTSATVSGGTTATYNLSLTAAPGFSGTVNLSCGGAPQYATCTISPTSLNLTSGGTGTFIVSVSTTTTQSASAKGSSTLLLAGVGLLAILTMPLVTRARRRSTIGMAILCCAAGVLALGATSCGGGGGGGGGGGSKTVTYTTPPGTYTLTLTASATAGSASQKLTLVVQ